MKKTKFNPSLPVDIFKDADEGVDQEEVLNINLAEVRDENGIIVDKSFISFANNDMKIRGDTKGEGINTKSGKEWLVRLKAEDRAGLNEYLDIKLILREVRLSDIQHKMIIWKKKAKAYC